MWLGYFLLLHEFVFLFFFGFIMFLHTSSVFIVHRNYVTSYICVCVCTCVCVCVCVCFQDSRLLYYFIRKIKMWQNINHIKVHNNTYFVF